MSNRHIVNLDFCRLTFYEWYVISEPSRGVDLTLGQIESIFTTTEQHYKHLYCFISDRKNSFSLNPLAYKSILSKQRNVVSIAVVCHFNQVKVESAKTQKHILQNIKPFAIFDDMDAAVEWSKAKLIKAVVVNPLRWELPQQSSSDAWMGLRN